LRKMLQTEGTKQMTAPLNPAVPLGDIAGRR
jgi:hypothetical protein